MTLGKRKWGSVEPVPSLLGFLEPREPKRQRTMDPEKSYKAEKEIEETTILLNYLLAHDMSFDNPENFSARAVKRAFAEHQKQRMRLDRAS